MNKAQTKRYVTDMLALLESEYDWDFPSDPDERRELIDNMTDTMMACWLTDPPPTRSGIPKGYKRVARPCPHFVPCADPNGCSGHELVPVSDPRPSID